MLQHYPRISVITPSFNQAQFLEKTIHSVLDQNYPNLEYIVIDGGSTDGSVDIIRRYSDKLAYWVSEADRGQVDAINKGLRRATGEWIGWQNSDDLYFPGVFTSLARAAARIPQDIDLIIGNMHLIDKNDTFLRDIKYVQPTYRSLLAEGMVLTNQAAFWKRSVHEKIGYLDESLDCGFDFEWFLRLLHEHRAWHVNRTWGALRLHDETKTSRCQTVFEEDYRRILQERRSSPRMVRFYQLRRLALMLLQGELAYVLRGIGRRLTIWINKTFRKP